MDQSDTLVPIPGLGIQDAAVIQSLLMAAGFFYRVHAAFGDGPDLVLIRSADVPAVKDLLRDYNIRSPRDKKIPFPW
jgi:hypothetical protein